ncbi:hypothetical protein GYN07_06885 [Rhizobium leguminosarum bv. viciae 248]|uniref:hypothetical protein n=1 Tax=Rhizobium leguminosarum TaxID=384 RepID=UPI0003714BBC|nr:hypothetical protein [Rhizobium leguminosarum]MCA2410956.1 hypothetical protein [Rhizobium leguminosarum]NKM60364.1 hypothetical protein [Rhizobium leguminosarum bv. viciae]QHW24074.1 hypothetical protein GYN07_06885 [Rhizobium leguminosarum bv. viciae 248]
MVSRQHRGSSVKHAGQFLPNGLHKSEIPDYLLSKSFEKRAGVWLPRREVLLGLAATATYAAMPVRPAKAISGAQLGATLGVAITAVELAKLVWDLGEKIIGSFTATNNDAKPQIGSVILAIINDSDEVESSQGRHFKIPKHTEAVLNFRNGPAPDEAGDKTFYVLAEDDYETFDIEVVEA